MPFTATHIAAVVPFAWLCHWRLPLSALAIGSMVPDVAGFYPNLFDYPTLHSFQGVFTHCIPLGLIGFFLFHWVLKQPLVDLLPPAFSRRLDGWSRRELDLGLVRILLLIGCVAFGALTHVVWDSFTHEAGWGVLLFPSLSRVVASYQGYSIRMYALLQHGSSLLLLPPMTVAFIWWVMRQPVSPTFDRRQQWAVPRTVSWTIGFMMAVGAWIYFQSLQANHLETTWVGALRVIVKHCGAIAILVLLLYCVGMQLAWWLQARLAGQEIADADLEFETGRSGRLLVAEPAHEVVRPSVPPQRRGEFTLIDPGHAPTAPGSSRLRDGSYSGESFEHSDLG